MPSGMAVLGEAGNATTIYSEEGAAMNMYNILLRLQTVKLAKICNLQPSQIPHPPFLSFPYSAKKQILLKYDRSFVCGFAWVGRGLISHPGF